MISSLVVGVGVPDCITMVVMWAFMERQNVQGYSTWTHVYLHRFSRLQHFAFAFKTAMWTHPELFRILQRCFGMYADMISNLIPVLSELQYEMFVWLVRTRLDASRHKHIIAHRTGYALITSRNNIGSKTSTSLAIWGPAVSVGASDNQTWAKLASQIHRSFICAKSRSNAKCAVSVHARTRFEFLSQFMKSSKCVWVFECFVSTGANAFARKPNRVILSPMKIKSSDLYWGHHIWTQQILTLRLQQRVRWYAATCGTTIENPILIYRPNWPGMYAHMIFQCGPSSEWTSIW